MNTDRKNNRPTFFQSEPEKNSAPLQQRTTEPNEIDLDTVASIFGDLVPRKNQPQ